MPRRLAHFSDPRLDAQIGEIIKKHKELQKEIKQLEKQVKHSNATRDAADKHAARRDNPHKVTAEQVGAPSAEEVQAKVDAHAGRTDNPHNVTAAQVGAPTQAAFNAHVTNTNNPHNVQAQQVLYSSGVSGFTPATVKAALDILADSRIVESGSNENGEYVRWENGLQVCFHSRAETVDITTAAGPLYRSDPLSWAFPAEFNAEPFAIADTNGANTTIWMRDGTTWAQFSYQYIATASLASESRTTHFFAIGRWK